MIEIVGTGITLSANCIYAILGFGILAMIQPYSRTLKVIGALIGMVAYGFLPYVMAMML